MRRSLEESVLPIMTETQRHSAILAYVQQKKIVSIPDLIDTIGMSPATARRDINKLHDAGKLRKVRNGAEWMENGKRQESWIPFDLEETPYLDEKTRIAKACAALLQPGDSAVINSGSTTFLAGKELCGHSVQVITNFYPLASYLIAQRHQSVVIIGGQYDYAQKITINLHDAMIGHYTATWMLTSGSGLTAEGLYKMNILLAVSEQKMLDKIGKLIVLVDSSKVGRGGGLLFCDAGRISTVITGKDADAVTLDALRQKGVAIIQV